VEAVELPWHKAYREHECTNKHVWIAKVRLSKNTQKLSGEVKEYCPICGQPALFSSAWLQESELK